MFRNNRSDDAETRVEGAERSEETRGKELTQG